MGNKKNNYSTHISAAKEWLGQAEASIEKDEDIRSDLNIMLAQAELQRAQEKDDLRLLKKWLKWTLPWLVAIFVAICYIYILRPDILNLTDKKADTNIGNTLPAEVKNTQTVDIKDIPIKEDAVIEGSQVELSEQKEDSDSTSLKQEELPDKAVNAVESTNEVKDIYQSQGIPSEEMQKMMQKAGRIIRE